MLAPDRHQHRTRGRGGPPSGPAAAVLGDAVNVAARFEQHAAPGQALVASRDARAGPVRRSVYRARPAARGQGQVPAPPGVPAPAVSGAATLDAAVCGRARRSSGAPRGARSTCAEGVAAASFAGGASG